MPKVLIVASTLTHLKNFHLPYMRWFKSRGVTVHAAAADEGVLPEADAYFPVPMKKSAVSPSNLRAAFELSRLIRENRYDLIVSHTALGGVVARCAVLMAGKSTSKILHTVHGYLFWDGCGLFTRFKYRTPEFLLRGVTDALVTMNAEDYKTAQKLVRKGGEVFLVPGMGVDGGRFHHFSAEEKKSARLALGIPEGAFALVCAAEFSRRKNHAELIRAFSEVAVSAPECLLLLCGTGALMSETKALAESLGIGERVRFLGWRSDLEKIYPACDMAVSAAVSEGLPFNVVEAQLCGLPVAASDIRGHTDLIEDGVTGLLYPSGNPEKLTETILRLRNCPELARSIASAAEKSGRRFTLDQAFKVNTDVYENLLGTTEKKH